MHTHIHTHIHIQLTGDFGGTLAYNHKQWLAERLREEGESEMTAAAAISASLGSGDLGEQMPSRLNYFRAADYEGEDEEIEPESAKEELARERAAWIGMFLVS